VKKLQAARATLKQIFKAYSRTRKITIPQRTSDDPADIAWIEQQVVGLDCHEFIRILVDGELVGVSLTHAKLTNVFAVSNQALFEVTLQSEVQLRNFHNLLLLSYQDFEQAILRCTLSSAAIHTKNFSGTGSRLNRLLETLFKNCASSGYAQALAKASPKGKKKKKKLNTTMSCIETHHRSP